jgi:hypothetical protein
LKSIAGFTAAINALERLLKAAVIRTCVKKKKKKKAS